MIYNSVSGLIYGAVGACAATIPVFDMAPELLPQIADGTDVAATVGSKVLYEAWSG